MTLPAKKAYYITIYHTDRAFKFAWMPKVYPSCQTSVQNMFVREQCLVNSENVLQFQSLNCKIKYCRYSNIKCSTSLKKDLMRLFK